MVISCGAAVRVVGVAPLGLGIRSVFVQGLRREAIGFRRFAAGSKAIRNLAGGLKMCVAFCTLVH